MNNTDARRYGSRTSDHEEVTKMDPLMLLLLVAVGLFATGHLLLH